MREVEAKRHQVTLVALRERVEEDYEGLRASLSREGHATGDLSHVPTHDADHDSEGLGVELAMEKNQADILTAIEDALYRISKGTFGRCEDCGAEITGPRLRAIPYAPCCLAC